MSKISVIFPVYNTEKYLDIALGSLINQTFKDFEVIAVNDGSSDNSFELLSNYSKFDERIKVFSTQNNGLSQARNFGVSKAQGKYVTFIDSDDYVSPVFLERLYKNLESTKSDFVFCDSLKIAPETNEVSSWDAISKKEIQAHTKKNFFSEDEVPALFWERILPSAWGKMYRRSFISDLKFPSGLIFEDVPYYSECYLKAKRISFDFERLYYYRFSREDSIMNSMQSRNLDIFKIYDMTEEIFKKYSKFEKFKNVFLFRKMKDCAFRLIKTNLDAKEEFFYKFKHEFEKLDFNLYDREYLEGKNVYHTLFDILRFNYKEYLEYEKNIV